MNAQSGTDDLRSQYQRLLRWYPREWRRRNEAIVLGTLLDEAQEAGRDHPTAGDRRSLVLGGVVARLNGSGRRSLVSASALAAGSVFALFYGGLIGWDPVHHYAGYLGPFTNPLVIAGALLIAAFVLAMVRLMGAAHVLAIASAVTSLIVGLLAWQNSWLGPSLSPVVLLAGLALLSLSRSNGVWRTLRWLAAIAFVAFGADYVGDLFNPGVVDKLTLGGIVTSSLAVAVLLAWPWKFRRQSLPPANVPRRHN
jgi:hypothetical protein